jgi:hypothetical protein
VDRAPCAVVPALRWRQVGASTRASFRLRACCPVQPAAAPHLRSPSLRPPVRPPLSIRPTAVPSRFPAAPASSPQASSLRTHRSWRACRTTRCSPTSSWARKSR